MEELRNLLVYLSTQDLKESIALIKKEIARRKKDLGVIVCSGLVYSFPAVCLSI